MNGCASTGLPSCVETRVPNLKPNYHRISLFSVHSSNFINRFERFPEWLAIFLFKKSCLLKLAWVGPGWGSLLINNKECDIFALIDC